MKTSIKAQIKKSLRDLGLLPGHTDYTRFIILGRSRSGSNLLRGLLAAHSQVIVFEEMFKDPGKIGWGLEGYPEEGKVLRRFQDDVLGFLDRDVFRVMPTEIKAVGFKIFYYHAFGTSLEAVWDYLKSHREVHVLHIKRRNILKTHLSRKRAMLTDQWINLSGEAAEQPVVALDYQECRLDFEQTRAWEESHDLFFNDHPLLEVVYEELARNPVDVMAEVQGFLGLDAEPVQPQTHQQSRQKLSEAIANYAELKERFKGSPWESFFTD